MKITRDIITDLLPVYLAGEASDDTCKLIDEFLKQDPDFAKLIAEQETPLAESPTIILKENEMQTLEKTKKLLWQRSMYMGFAIFFTLFTVAFKFGPEGVHWIWEGTPIQAVVCVAVGILMWVKYAQTSRTLQGSDL
ncbi:MAG: hypothetical protein ABI904_09710 [Chloroflexota bacterium]